MPIARRWVRSRARWFVAILGASTLTCWGSPVRADASIVPTGFVDQSMLTALSEPVGIAEVPDPPSRPTRRVLFVEQRTARVGLVDGVTQYTVGVVPGVSSVDNERGLLGIAVDPGWPQRPYVYIHCTDGRVGHRIAISRFTLTGDLKGTLDGRLQFDASSRFDLLTRPPDDAVNHNGGTVRFGPDGRLYVSLGDDATGCPAQDITYLAGKILRLDVSRLPAGPGGPPPIGLLVPPDNPFVAQPDSNAMLVWTEGLRNPFRFQIDPLTGILYIADVGQTSWEELDRVDASGMDMGWPFFEGPASFSTCTLTPPAPFTAPIYSYDHSVGLVIIAGGLYRAPAVGTLSFPAEYEGDCFILDYYYGIMRRLKGSGTTWDLATPVAGQPDPENWGLGFDTVSDMLELSDGTLWYCRQFVNGAPGSGEVRRIVYPPGLDVPLTSPAAIALAPPRPTPSSGSITLEWAQPRPDRVRLTIYDLGGRRVRRLEGGTFYGAGTHQSLWDGRDDSGARTGPGLYFVRLEVGESTRQARVTLIP